MYIDKLTSMETSFLLKNYKLKIIHDNGLYRHLCGYHRGDPYLEEYNEFYIVTAPNIVTIYGPWTNAYTFCGADDDLFLTTFNKANIDVDDLVKKLAVDDSALNGYVYDTDLDYFLREVNLWLSDTLQDIPETADEIFRQITIGLDPSNPNTLYSQLMDMTFTTYPSEGSSLPVIYYGHELFGDVLEPTAGRDYTPLWKRAVLALRWAAQKYNTLTKH